MIRTENKLAPTSTWLRYAVGVAISVAAPGVVHAGGLWFPGWGPVSMGRAGASVASLDDASVIALNPARLAAIKGTTSVHVGTALIDYDMTYTRSGVYEDVIDPDRSDAWEGMPYPTVEDTSSPPVGIGPYQVIPVLGVSFRPGAVEGLTLAAGVSIPTSYPTRTIDADYVLEDPSRPPPPSRYDILEQEAAIVHPSIAAAYQVTDELAVGARFSAGFGHVKATSYIWGFPNYDEWAGRDAEFTVEARDNFIPSFGVGAHYAVSDAIELAASWNSSYAIDGKGTGSAKTGSGNELGGRPITIVPSPNPLCEAGGTADNLKACVRVPLPWIATVGGRYIVRDDDGGQVADIELDVAYEAWGSASDFDVIVDGYAAVELDPLVGLTLEPSVIRHNFQDVISVRLGGSWQKPMGFGRLTVRGGVAHDTAAAPKGWERLDLDGAARTTGMVGASLRLERVQIDVGAGIVHEGTRSHGTGCNPAPFEGCAPGSDPDGRNDRMGPDPIQPTAGAGSQPQSPFNEGEYKSGYTVLTLGFSTWF